jgi:uncharacterized repeat protein (TIGR03803 family)
MNGPFARLIFDSAGNLYSTAVRGGAVGYGTVFELMPKAGRGWTEKVLHSFGAGNDGLTPYGGLVRDGLGNLYDATVFGGTSNNGTVFKITP